MSIKSLDKFKDEWIEMEVGKSKKNPLISLSKGKAKYIRFNPSFIGEYNLKDDSYVKILINKKNNTIKVGFLFNKDKLKNSLKISRNKKTGTGYVSGGSLYKKLLSLGIDIEKLNKTNFEPKISEIEGHKIFIIELWS